MVQSIQPPLVCLLAPDAVYRRRLVILEALNFEHKLEYDAFKDLEARCEIAEKALEAMQEERDERENAASSLEDCVTSLTFVFSKEQRAEITAAAL